MKIVTTILFPNFFSFLLTCILAANTISLSYSQKYEGIDRDLTIGKMKARADHAIKTGDIYTAQFYYEEIVKKDTQDIDACYKLAEVYRMSRNYKKAEETYSKVFERSPEAYSTALFNKAAMQKMSGNYKSAKANFIFFQKNYGKTADADLRNLLAKEIAGCDSGMTYTDFPENVTIENLGNPVNRPHAEFSPFLLDSNTLVFGSLRMDTLKYFDVRYDHYEKQPVRQVYKAKKVNGKWKEEGKYEVFNDPTMDMGNFVYSPISGRYYFSKCSKNESGTVHCKIYYTESVNGKFSKPVMLPHPVNSEGYTSTQPTIMVDTSTTVTTPKPGKKPVSKNNSKPPVKGTPKGKTPVKPAAKPAPVEYLYFVSDRPGGKGGLDIWYTYYNSARKEWVAPVNFSLNTPQTECTPFYHISSKNLYFSSNGYTSAGGLDIFRSPKTDGRFTKPQNLSFPINSPQDELGFMLSDDGKKGMLVSNRPGGTPYLHETCCDDIYSFEIHPPKPFNCTLDLRVLAPDSVNCNDLVLKIKMLDLKTGKESSAKVSPNDCKYQLALNKNTQYKFTIDRTGFQKDTLTIETKEMASSEINEKVFELKAKEKKVVVKPEEGKTFVLNDIQYETNQTELNENAKAVLDSVVVPFMKSHPEDILIISSHTDDMGSHHYNSTLSHKRAANVVAYLESKGISKHRLQGKGFGENHPIAPNQNPDGSDNPVGRGLNRRTEFLITKPSK